MSAYLNVVTVFILLVTITIAQDYQDYNEYANDYAQDNLYQDYAKKQQEKVEGGGGGFNVKYAAVGGAMGWFFGGKVHSGRVRERMKADHQKSQKKLYKQYYNDIYTLQEENQQLRNAAEQLQKAIKGVQEKQEREALQRDYDEFKQPDVDGDDRISRAEFNVYVKNYLANYPGLQEKDYPKFEDFDHDNDGFITFQEYTQQMALEVQKAERDKRAAEKQGASTRVKKQAIQRADALKSLYNNDYVGTPY